MRLRRTALNANSAIVDASRVVLHVRPAPAWSNSKSKRQPSGKVLCLLLNSIHHIFCRAAVRSSRSAAPHGAQCTSWTIMPIPDHAMSESQQPGHSAPRPSSVSDRSYPSSTFNAKGCWSTVSITSLARCAPGPGNSAALGRGLCALFDRNTGAILGELRQTCTSRGPASPRPSAAIPCSFRAALRAAILGKLTRQWGHASSGPTRAAVWKNSSGCAGRRPTRAARHPGAISCGFRHTARSELSDSLSITARTGLATAAGMLGEREAEQGWR